MMNDDERYIRKDIFDANMQRMEAIMAANLAKHDSIAADIKMDNIRFEGKIDSMAARLDTLQSRFSWNLAWMGIVIGTVLAIVQHLWK